MLVMLVNFLMVLLIVICILEYINLFFIWPNLYTYMLCVYMYVYVYVYV